MTSSPPGRRPVPQAPRPAPQPARWQVGPPAPVAAPRPGDAPAPATPVLPPASLRPGPRDLVRAGLVTAVTAALACVVLWGLGRLLGAPPAVRLGAAVVDVAWWQVGLAAAAAAGAVASASGLLLGVRGAAAGVRLAGRAGLLAGAAWALAQPDGVAWSTRVLLVAVMAAAYAVAVPAVARVAGDADPRAEVRHGA